MRSPLGGAFTSFTYLLDLCPQPSVVFALLCMLFSSAAALMHRFEEEPLMSPESRPVQLSSGLNNGWPLTCCRSWSTTI
jgi:hypothetical protein